MGTLVVFEISLELIFNHLTITPVPRSEVVVVIAANRIEKNNLVMYG